jgi:hypothetical protein
MKWILTLEPYQQAQLSVAIIVPFIVLFVGLWWRWGKIVIEVRGGKEQEENDYEANVYFRALNSTNNSIEIFSTGFVSRGGELVGGDSMLREIVDAHKHSTDMCFQKVDLQAQAKYPLLIWVRDATGKVFKSKPFKFKPYKDDRFPSDFKF